MAQAAWQIREKPLDRLDNVEKDRSWTTRELSSSSFAPEKHIMLMVVDRPPSRIRNFIDGALWSSKLLVEDGADQWGNSWQNANTNQRMLYTVAPDMVPEPLSWSTLEANPDGHFFLCKFVNLADEIPDPSLVCKKLAELHRKSITMSPNGMYGFEMQLAMASSLRTTPGMILGKLSLSNRWMVHLRQKRRNGENSLKPALVHGDLWDGNVSFLVETDEPYIYDASAFWGHNESAIEELVRKFLNGYEGSFDCKGRRARDSVSLGKAVSRDVHGRCTPTTVGSGMVVDQQDEMVPSADPYRQIQGPTSIKMENAADAIGMAVYSPENTGSEVRFGESAISPMSGSEAGIHKRYERFDSSS
ncbi:hypothetical protein EPUS_08546 [Endocarpon pusillum Z07020]|uniref:protein-ribulosamine 3-kinase n=1 Tax=Endocarpon pusillum (strain Z07020 / HMAS-L-300199) TaxID=1263415 RepID=U1GMB3_ENDPU|nr:uncharacterized protein EPUS_08546 [Endocarpon pusillum Z07020]ERF73403.1 hypothetical protein EPUS_08546 [Endocarpon pusillum Z07020]